MPCRIDSPADVTAIVSLTSMLPSVCTAIRESKERMRSTSSCAAAGANTATHKQKAAKSFFMEFELHYIPRCRWLGHKVGAAAFSLLQPPPTLRLHEPTANHRQTTYKLSHVSMV